MKYIHGFLQVPGMSYQILSKIWDGFHDWRYAWEKASKSDFIRLKLKVDIVEAIDTVRRGFDIEKAAAGLWERDIFLIGRESEEYPEILNTIAEPPFLLYRKGMSLSKLPKGVAVVGTRVPSVYGERISYDVSEKLGSCGLTVVSGLAFGVDAAAHLAAAQSGYPTVAVLASGLEKITPTSHTSLARLILEKGGTLLSEYPPNVSALKHHFLWRNRIISGLCKATIVIEAQNRSGALVTAEHALKQKRKVFALVGDIDRTQAQGCLKLLKNRSVEPLYSLSQLDDLTEKKDLSLNDFENMLDTQILCFVKKRTSFDELCSFLQKESSDVLSATAMLEIRGALERDTGGYFCLTDIGKKLRDEIIRAGAEDNFGAG